MRCWRRESRRGVTFFHWDLPQALEEKGGWRSRGTVEAFAAYAEFVVKEYGGKVKNWITLNEIICFTYLGYGGQEKAPGRNDGRAAVNPDLPPRASLPWPCRSRRA